MKSDEDNIVGYEPDGTPITNEEFIADINLALQQLKDGTLETLTTEEVREKIFGKSNNTCMEEEVLKAAEQYALENDTTVSKIVTII